MTTVVITKKTKPTELFEEFDRDILHDAHSPRQIAQRSDAAKECQRRGKGILADVGGHLRTLSDSDVDPAVLLGWKYLLTWMKFDGAEEHRPPVEASIGSWLVWCGFHAPS